MEAPLIIEPEDGQRCRPTFREWAGFLCFTMGVVLAGVGYGTPHLVEISGVSLGFFAVCTNNQCYAPSFALQVDFLPSWWRRYQGVGGLGVAGMTVAWVLVVCWMFCVQNRKHLNTALVVSVVIGILAYKTALIVFLINLLDWFPDDHSFGYSFYLACLGLALEIAAPIVFNCCGAEKKPSPPRQAEIA